MTFYIVEGQGSIDLNLAMSHMGMTFRTQLDVINCAFIIRAAPWGALH